MRTIKPGIPLCKDCSSARFTIFGWCCDNGWAVTASPIGGAADCLMERSDDGACGRSGVLWRKAIGEREAEKLEIMSGAAVEAFRDGRTPMTTKQTCANCRFCFQNHGNPREVSWVGLPDDVGECRAHPPEPGMTTAGFPKVYTNWWCGEWEATEPKLTFACAGCGKAITGALIILHGQSKLCSSECLASYPYPQP